MIPLPLGLPRWAKIAGAIAAFCLLAFTLHKCAVRDAVEADRAEANAEAVSTAREADEAARGEIDATRNEVEARNEKARNAASGSDDPLGDALRSLRD